MASKDSSIDWWKRHPGRHKVDPQKRVSLTLIIAEAYGSIAGVLGLILVCCLYVLWRGPNRRLWWWKKDNPTKPERIEGGHKKLHPSQETIMYSDLGNAPPVTYQPMSSTSPPQQSQPSFSRDGSAVLPLRKSRLFTLKQSRKLAAAVNENTPPVPTRRPTSSPAPPNPRLHRESREPALPTGTLPPGAAPPSGGSLPLSQGQRVSGIPSARRSVSSPMSAYSESDFGGNAGRLSYQTYPPPLPSPPQAYAPFMSKTPPPGASVQVMRASANTLPSGATAYAVRSPPPVFPHLAAPPLSQQRGASPSNSAHGSNLLRPGATSPQSTISGHSQQRLSAQQLSYSHAQTLNALAGNTLTVHPPNGSAASHHAHRLSSRSAKSATSIIPSPLAQSLTGKDLGANEDVYATEFGAAVDSKRYQHRSVTYVPNSETETGAPLAAETATRLPTPSLRNRGGAI